MDDEIEEEEELYEEEGETLCPCEENEGDSGEESADLKPKEKTPPIATSKQMPSPNSPTSNQPIKRSSRIASS